MGPSKSFVLFVVSHLVIGNAIIISATSNSSSPPPFTSSPDQPTTATQQDNTALTVSTSTTPNPTDASLQGSGTKIPGDDAIAQMIKEQFGDKGLDMLSKVMALLKPESSESGASEDVLPVDPMSLLAASLVTSDTSSLCKMDLWRAVNGLKAGEQWAKLLLDSMGKPESGLEYQRYDTVGDYKECRDTTAPPWQFGKGYKGNYCVVFLSPKTKDGKTLGVDKRVFLVELGVCLPDTCTREDVTQLANDGLEALNYSNVLKAIFTDCRTDHREITTATVLAIICVIIIGILMILGTCYDIAFIQWPKWEKARDENHGNVDCKGDKQNGNLNTVETAVKEGKESDLSKNGWKDHVLDGQSQPIKGHSEELKENKPLIDKGDKETSGADVVKKILIAFSVYDNGRSILKTTKTAGDVGVLHGIRFISITWVIWGHSISENIENISNTRPMIHEIMESKFMMFISNGYKAVDTFYTLTGFLVGYTMYRHVKEKGWRYNWLAFYIRRLWRLTPPYMLVILTTLGLQRFMGSGARWATEQPKQKEQCEKYWWSNLLYINNFFNPYDRCMPHCWYLATDMQFYVISPLLLIPLHYNVRLGIACCLTALTASVITTITLSEVEHWPITPSEQHKLFPTDDGRYQNASLQQITDGSVDYFDHYYVTPYCRIGPFIMGLLAGHFFKQNKEKIFMKRNVVAIGWIVAIATGLIVTWGIHDALVSDDYPHAVKSIYSGFSGTAWGMCICWVILACASGYGGPINALLSWSPFMVLSRLTYMMYLTHYSVHEIIYGNMGSSYYFTYSNMMMVYLASLVMTVAYSFVAALAFEWPMASLSPLIVPKT